MKGSNELRLNKATMIEAVQYWLNSQMTNHLTVTDVEEEKSVVPMFKITLESKEVDDEPFG